MSQPTVICLGEVLWDMLPTEKVAGGAPMNVAFHLNQLGISTAMVSKVGSDDLGKEIIDFLKQKNIRTDYLQQDDAHPTGTVKVCLDANGHPSYEIVENVAWDYIEATEQIIPLLKASRALVFGTLMARSPISRQTLLRFIEAAPVRVLDVNLRSPFFSKKLLDELLPLADIVKMNDSELDIIAEWNAVKGTQHEKMSWIKSHYHTELLIVTRGEHGAIVLNSADEYIQHKGYEVVVKDTIGSGDAFLASYLSKHLRSESVENCLDFACRMGAFVATQSGGTPDLPVWAR